MSITGKAAKSKSIHTLIRRRFERKPSPLARCIGSAGAVNAGVLLNQIVYRFKHNDTLLCHKSRLWIAQTAACWFTEAGLTSKQYKRALAILKKLGLIEVTHVKVRSHHRWPTTFIRLVEGFEDAAPVVPTGTIPSGPSKAHPTVVPTGTAKSGEVLPMNEKKGIFAPAAHKSTQEKETQKSEQGKVSVMKKDIEAAWKNAYAAIYPELDVTPFAGPDWNNAGILITKLGEDAPAVADAVVANWSSFLRDLHHAKGLYDQGDRPCLHKLANHVDVALGWWKRESPLTSAEMKLQITKEASGGNELEGKLSEDYFNSLPE